MIFGGYRREVSDTALVEARLHPDYTATPIVKHQEMAKCLN